MKITLWYHIVDGGDGSAYSLFFNTKEEAQESADKELEYYGQSLCDNVSSHEFVIEDGMLINTDNSYWNDWEDKKND